MCLRLNDQMGNLGDVLVRINHQGRASNRVRIAIGYRGGGPLDDPGSGPTPAPPYVIRGRVTDDGNPLAGATVSLSGDASAVTTTDSDGNYSILAPPSRRLPIVRFHFNEDYIFAPANYSLLQIDGERHADFVAATFHRVLSGRVTDADGRGVFGVKSERERNTSRHDLHSQRWDIFLSFYGVWQLRSDTFEGTGLLLVRAPERHAQWPPR